MMMIAMQNRPYIDESTKHTSPQMKSPKYPKHSFWSLSEVLGRKIEVIFSKQVTLICQIKEKDQTKGVIHFL